MEQSYLLKRSMGTAYPFILIFGIYTILNGHITPGGGFQGGAILAALFMVNFLITDTQTINLRTLTHIEKILYVAIVCFAIVFVLYNNPSIPIWLKEMYLILMNVLIGIKVCCGLTVIFFRFVLFESR